MPVPKPLRLLIVEDSESDAALVVRLLSKAGYSVTSHRVETRGAMLAALTPDTWDCIIADHNMPEFDAFSALDNLQSTGLDIPFIVVSGSIGEEAAVALMKAGAADYVMKDKLARLTAVMARELHEAASRRERRLAEEALRASEEKYRQLFDVESDALFLIDRESGRILEANASATALYGYSHDEWLTMRNVDVSVEPDKTSTATHTGITDIPIRWHRKKDGAIFPVDIKATHFDWQGRAVHLAAIRDVTERVRTEQALRASEERLRDITFSMADWVWEVDENGVYTYSSQKGSEFFGPANERIIGRTPFDLMPPDEAKRVGAIFSQIAAAKAPIKDLENWNINQKGERFCLLTNGVPILDAEGNLKGYRGVDKDITARKRAEEQIRQSEADLRQAQGVAHVGNWRWDIQTGHLTWSDEMYHIFGITKEGFSGSLLDVIARTIHPDDREKVEAANLSVVQQGKPAPLEYRVVWPDGSVRVVWAEAGELTRDEAGNPSVLTGIVHDITERKRIEEALRNSNNLLQRTLAGLDETVLVLDVETRRIIMCNPATERIFGYRPEELIGQTTQVLHVSQESYDAFLPKRIAITGPDGIAHLEYQMRRKDGSIFWSEVTVAELRGDGDSPPLVVSVLRDITERVRAQEELRQRNVFVENLLERAPIGFAVNTIHDGKRVYVSRNFESIYGVAPDTINSVADYFEKVYLDPVFREQIRERIMADMATGDAARMRWEDIPITTRMGEHRVVTAVNIPLLDQNLMISTVQDVTERKRAEEALRQTERDLVDAQKLAGIGSWTYDPVTQQPKWSDGMFLIWGLDPKRGAPDYAEHGKLIHPEDFQRFDDAVQAAVQHGTPYQLDLRICRPDGALRTITTICEPQVDAKGNVVNLRGTTQDITERKRAEDLIRASLREKEILLREIHHRVKNNLQVIASLLTLQAQSVSDLVALDVLRDSQNRIRAMSLIHAKLYESADLATVDFGAFARDLGTILVRAYAVAPPAINLIVTAGQADLDIDTLVPCSLIVNELVANAIKHAFPSGTGGTVTVSLSKVNDRFLLRVADDGIGFPNAMDFRNTKSLGLRLVNMLVEQLDGSIELHGEGGTEFIIRFPGTPTA